MHGQGRDDAACGCGNAGCTGRTLLRFILPNTLRKHGDRAQEHARDVVCTPHPRSKQTAPGVPLPAPTPPGASGCGGAFPSPVRAETSLHLVQHVQMSSAGGRCRGFPAKTAFTASPRLRHRTTLSSINWQDLADFLLGPSTRPQICPGQGRVAGTAWPSELGLGFVQCCAREGRGTGRKLKKSYRRISVGAWSQ